MRNLILVFCQGVWWVAHFILSYKVRTADEKARYSPVALKRTQASCVWRKALLQPSCATVTLLPWFWNGCLLAAPYSICSPLEWAICCVWFIVWLLQHLFILCLLLRLCLSRDDTDSMRARQEEIRSLVVLLFYPGCRTHTQTRCQSL